MRRTRKSDAVADDVWPVGFDWPDMCRRDFCTPASIDKLKPGNGAALIIRAQNDTAEHAVTQYPGYGNADTVALLFEFERYLLLGKTGGRHVVIEPRQQRRALREAEFDYSPKVLRRNWTNCRLSASGNAAAIIENSLSRSPYSHSIVPSDGKASGLRSSRGIEGKTVPWPRIRDGHRARALIGRLRRVAHSAIGCRDAPSPETGF